MILVLQWALLALVAVLSALTVRYSFKSRRAGDPRLRGLYGARMNISMGSMVIGIACLYMLLFSGSTLKVIVGAVLILLGLFNIFAGLRNHAVYSRKES
ncbi:MAG TPA: YtpI family protein [Paenibacillaceae bacterium]